MHQIYRKTAIPKCDFNKVSLQIYLYHTSAWAFSFFCFNNFILCWYCTIAEANKNQPLITINMVKKIFYLRHVGADTKIISMWQPYTDMSIPH